MMSPHERTIQAAEGYLELKMFSQVWKELHSLPAEQLGTEQVLEIFIHSLMGEARWEDALTVIRRLRTTSPEKPEGFIHEAYCLHELGQTREALNLLLEGPAVLHERALYFYNAGCYHAQLGEVDDAMRMLEQSFAMDKALKKSAKHDPDLAGLRALL